MEQTPLQKQFFESYDEFSEAIFRHCFFKVSDRDVSLDLMQDTFMKTWKYLKKGKDIHDVKAFLYKVANNLIIDYYRKKKSISLDELMDREDTFFQPTDDSHQNILTEAEVGRVIKLINKLDEPYKQAVTMRYIDGLPPQDIAEIIGESANNVSVRITRGLEKLKEQMK